jgi:hypothetical protein
MTWVAPPGHGTVSPGSSSVLGMDQSSSIGAAVLCRPFAGVSSKVTTRLSRGTAGGVGTPPLRG